MVALRNKTIFLGGSLWIYSLVFACKQINLNIPAMKEIKGHHAAVESKIACTDTFSLIEIWHKLPIILLSTCTNGYVRLRRRLTWNVVSSDVLSSLATVMLPVASLIVKYLGTGGSIMYRMEDWKSKFDILKSAKYFVNEFDSKIGKKTLLLISEISALEGI